MAMHGLLPEHELAIELLHLDTKVFEDAPPFRRDPIGPPFLGASPCVPPQPPVSLHASEEWVQGPRAQYVAVLRQLSQHP
jgi:hypothetical protein